MPEILIRNFIFKPNLLPSIVAFAFLYLMISLGNWQLDRADYKSNLQSIIESRQSISPVKLSDLIDREKDDWIYHPALAAGKYDTDHQIYYDNQVHNMTAGYSIFTPLRLTQTTGVLVNRGWIAVGKSRTELPEITLNNNDTVSITGLLSTPPSKGVVLSESANSYMEWPTVLQYIDTVEIEKKLDYKLLPMVLIMNDPQQTALEVMPIKINMRSEKHTAYAFQWFALSLTLLIIYIVVNTKNIHKTKQADTNE